MIPARAYPLLLAFFTLGALSACTSAERGIETPFRNSIFSTQSMPKGYKYLDNTPITSAAPSTPWVKSATAVNTENMGAMNAAWQGAVYELVEKMAPNLPQDGTPLNLSSAKYSIMRGEKDNALDHYLRQALIQKGYNLTTIPDAGLPVTYKTETAKELRTYNLTTSILDKDGKARFVTTVPAVLPE